jgi:hypothetical protein
METKETYMNLDDINNILSDYRAKKIHLKEVLEYFQVEFFHNWVYSNCTDALTEIVTVEEASIYCLLNYRDQLTPLLTYPELAAWKQLSDYVEVLYRKDRYSYESYGGEIPDEEMFRVSNINWDTYDLWIRPIHVTPRMSRAYKIIDGWFINPPQEVMDHIVVTDKLLNVLNNKIVKDEARG